MQTSISVGIPVKSYLKKFILRNTTDDVLKISTGRQGHIADYIFTILSKSSVQGNNRLKTQPYDDTLTIVIPWHFAKEGRYYISPNHVLRIHRFVKSLIEEKVYDFLDETCVNRGEIRKNMISQLARYDITEQELSLDTMMKSYYRHRKAKGMILYKK